MIATHEHAAEVSIACEADIVRARQVVRTLASELGFGITDVTRIITAAAELARNVFRYAGSGVMRYRALDDGPRTGIELVFEDHGPGIPDVEQALQEGYTTSKGLGMGLPGTRRLMDEMEIQSAPGEGTIVTVRKWRRR